MVESEQHEHCGPEFQSATEDRRDVGLQVSSFDFLRCAAWKAAYVAQTPP